MRAMVLTGLLVLVLTPDAGAGAGLTDADVRAFAWFDSLGYPDVKDRPLVRVPADPKSSWEPDGDAVQGFSLRESDGTRTILDHHLATYVVSETRTAEPVDFRAHVEAEIERLRTPPDDPFMELFTAGRLDSVVTLFVLARHAHCRGESPLAVRAIREARRIQGERGSRTFEDSIRASLDWNMAYHAFADFRKNRIPRPELLRGLRRYIRCFPEGTHVTRARETVEILEQMVKEDEKHARTARPLVQLEGEGRIAEMIFRLRDQPGSAGWRGWSSIRTGFGEKTPADLLIATGPAAVPQLVDALANRSFTRVVSNGRMGIFPERIHCVGDAVRSILSDITNRYCGGDEKKLARFYRAWWEEYDRKGRRRYLLDEVRTLATNRFEPALRTLFHEAPDDALAVFREVWAKARSEKRGRMIGIALDSGRAELTPYVLEAARNGHDRAATALLNREYPGIMDDVIAAWRRGKADGCADILALRAGAKTVPMVFERVATWEDMRLWSFFSSLEGQLPERLPGMTTEHRKLLGNSILPYLAEADSPLPPFGSSMRARMVNEVAAALCILAEARCSLDPEARHAIRRTQVAMVRNVWRTFCGRPPLPIEDRLVTDRPGSFRVRSLVIAPESQPLPSGLAALAKTMVDSQLDPQLIRALVVAAASDFPKGSGRVNVEAWQRADRTGYVLSVALLPRRPGAGIGWAICEEIRVGERPVRGPWCSSVGSIDGDPLAFDASLLDPFFRVLARTLRPENLPGLEFRLEIEG